MQATVQAAQLCPLSCAGLRGERSKGGSHSPRDREDERRVVHRAHHARRAARCRPGGWGERQALWVASCWYRCTGCSRYAHTSIRDLMVNIYAGTRYFFLKKYPAARPRARTRPRRAASCDMRARRARYEYESYLGTRLLSGTAVVVFRACFFYFSRRGGEGFAHHPRRSHATVPRRHLGWDSLEGPGRSYPEKRRFSAVLSAIPQRHVRPQAVVFRRDETDVLWTNQRGRRVTVPMQARCELLIPSWPYQISG